MSRCPSCASVSTCPICGSAVQDISHVGVRGNESSFKIPIIDYTISTGGNPSGIRHYAKPCGHRIVTAPVSADLVYNGGPLWGNGYTWVNIFWGTFYADKASQSWISRVNRATSNIETDQSYSGGLKQYNVGMGRLLGSTVVPTDPPATISNTELANQLISWISSGIAKDVGSKGAYNIFLPPGVTVTLSSEGSCAVFCDYHDTVDGAKGPFYTVEPYPCSSGCNQCTSSEFDTLTMGLSEELIELKTDMNPGTGWVIGNEELCDFCDKHFVCNKLPTGEYVNAWYDRAKGACWTVR